MYYAKSKRADGSQPTVSKHLDAVSEQAAKYGHEIGAVEQARIAGLMHDFGKCSERFQEVLRNENQNIDHAASSAAMLYYLWSRERRTPGGTKKAIIEAVNGHHAGLTDFDTVKNLLRDSFSGLSYLTTKDGKLPSLCDKNGYRTAYDYFRKDHPDERLMVPKWDLPSEVGNLETMLYTRMLLSCLVDADYSISAWEDDKSYFENTEAPALDVDDSLSRLYALTTCVAPHAGARIEIRIQINWQPCVQSPLTQGRELK